MGQETPMPTSAFGGFNDFLTGAKKVHGFAPGRTELAGNHVDHQGGMVLTSTLSQGIDAIACENNTDVIRVSSKGFPSFTVDLPALRNADSPFHDLFGTSKALVAGVVMALEQRGGKGRVRGFDLQMESTLLSGGGLSSSAAFEILVGAIINTMFFDEAFTPLDLAKAGLEAETHYFGKSCGLMDQTAIAIGGIVCIDFAQETPEVTPIPFDFASNGASVVLVDVHADHSTATSSYTAIPRHMFEAASTCKQERLSDVSEQDLLDFMPDIRMTYGDVPFLRAMHYLREVRLVQARKEALVADDIAAYCKNTALSASSSAQYLQNISEAGSIYQPAMVALALADLVLDDLAIEATIEGEAADMAPWPRGVARIHGGGFGGTIQVYIPSDRAPEFVKRVDASLGENSATILTLTQKGAYAEWM